MRNPIYFLQRNVGIVPLTGALVGGAVGFAVGSTGRLAVDSINFVYETVVNVARTFPYSLQANPSQIISNVVTQSEESLAHALYDGVEAGAVYSAGSLLLMKKIVGIFSSKKREVS